jgi:protein subunit release factor A
MTHTPSGVSVTVDGRSRRQNEKEARRLLRRKLEEVRLNHLAARRKAARDEKIRFTERIRTYDYSRGVVTDHRTGKTASIKDIMEKGLLGKLR